MNLMLINTVDGSYQISFNHTVVSPEEAERLYREAVNLGEYVEMSLSAQRLVQNDFDVDALIRDYEEMDRNT